jgi:hypothetical protein
MTLNAYAGSNEHSKWYDSLRTSETYKSKFIINGDVAGEFSNATGGQHMVTGGSDNHFTWGTSAIANQDPSWMLFNGSPFANVSNDTRFKLGELSYYNGTIKSGTGSEFVDIGIALTFAGTAAPIDFNFTLELINSINIAGNEVASADYVKLNNISSDFALSLGGVDYKLKLEFGETTNNGFSNLEEFFVFENSVASGALYGTLVPVILETPLATGNAYGLNGGNGIGNAFGLIN